MTNKEIYDWMKDGYLLTSDDYAMCEVIVRESMDRLCSSYINGSVEFLRAIEAEMEKRNDLYQKMHSLYTREVLKQNDKL